MCVQHTSVLWLRYNNIINVVGRHTFLWLFCVMTMPLHCLFQLSWNLQHFLLNLQLDTHINTGRLNQVLPSMPIFVTHINIDCSHKQSPLNWLTRAYSHCHPTTPPYINNLVGIVVCCHSKMDGNNVNNMWHFVTCRQHDRCDVTSTSFFVVSQHATKTDDRLCHLVEL